MKVPSPFKDKTVNQILTLVEPPKPDPEKVVQKARRMYNGDHWMNGDGWIGPTTDSGEEIAEVKAEIHKVFSSRNVILEVVDRKVDGCLKDRPQMKFIRKNPKLNNQGQPDDDKDTLLEEANNLFQSWFNDKELLKRLKAAYGSNQLGERVLFRIYVPRGYLKTGPNGATVVPSTTIEDALSIIYPDVVVSETSGKAIDPDTQLEAMVINTVKDNEEYTEICFVDQGKTIVRTRTRKAPNPVVITTNNLEPTAKTDSSPENVPSTVDTPLDMGGQLTIHQLRTRPVITQQIIENQVAINMQKTLMNRNSISGGFLERIITDAMPPGDWIDNPDDPSGPQIYKLKPFRLGSGTTNFIKAAEYVNDETGETKYGSPSVNYRDPITPDTFISAKADFYGDVLEEAGQPHILISGDATSYGKSREQARETYKGTLEDDQGEIESLVTWLMIAVMNMAAFFSGKPNRYQDLQPVAKCRINLGPQSGNDRQDDREAVKAGQMSIETSIVRSGIDDPKAEVARMMQEANTSDEVRAKRIEMIVNLVDIGVAFEPAAIYAGVPEDQAKAMAKEWERIKTADVTTKANPANPNDKGRVDPTNVKNTGGVKK